MPTVHAAGISIRHCVLAMFVICNGIWAKKGPSHPIVLRPVGWAKVPDPLYWVSNNRPVKIQCTAKHARSLVLICNRSILLPQPTRGRGGPRTLSRTWMIRASDLSSRAKSVFRCRCRAWGKRGRPITTNNTVIKVSYLKENFGEVNRTQTVATNNTIALKCKAPAGEPRPSIQWTKDGNLLGKKELKALRLRQTKKNNLLIKVAEIEHTGQFQCIVKNIAGTHKGPVISLIVGEERPETYDAISLCDKTNGSLRNSSNCTVTKSRPARLFVATQTSIKQISLDISQKPFAVKKHESIDTSAEDVTTSTFDNSLYWTDRKSIRRIAVRNFDYEEVTVVTGPRHVGGIAVDGIHRKLYWTDPTLNTIQAVDLRNYRLAVVIGEGLNRPGAIAVDPQHGYIYWTERGGDSPRIVQAGLDGSHVEPLITENIRHPNGLTVDYTAQRLYWSDGYYGTVQSSWLNGSDRSTIVNGTGKFEPYGVAVLGNHVYWTDRATNSLNSVHKLMGGEERVVLEGLSRPSGIAVLNSDAQPPDTSPCGNKNGGCSHLCLTSPGKRQFRCVCDADDVLSEDGKICRNKAKTDLSKHLPRYPGSSNAVLIYILIAAVAVLTMSLILTQLKNNHQNRKMRSLLRNRQQLNAAVENEISTALEASDATGAFAEGIHGSGAALPEEQSLMQGNDRTRDQTKPSDTQRLTFIKIYDTRLQQYGGVAAIGDNTTVNYAGTEQGPEQENTEDGSQESAEDPV